MDAKVRARLSPRRPSAAAVESALERLLAEEALKLSERNRRFLAYVASEALAGRGDRIKAYTIGVDVFGRGEDFDPSNDPIVRIEATRIRSALSAYYRRPGSRDRVIILIPPGSYVPTFICSDRARSESASGEWDERDGRASEASPLYTSSAAAGRRPSVVIATRSDPNDQSGTVHVEMMKQSIAVRLRTMKVRVFMMPPRERKAAAKAVERLLLHPDSVYALDLSLYNIADRHRQSWTLTDLSSGELMDSLFVEQIGKDAGAVVTIDGVVERVANMVENALALR
jgi:hypothetical protein